MISRTFFFMTSGIILITAFQIRMCVKDMSFSPAFREELSVFAWLPTFQSNWRTNYGCPLVTRLTSTWNLGALQDFTAPPCDAPLRDPPLLLAVTGYDQVLQRGWYDRGRRCSLDFNHCVDDLKSFLEMLRRQHDSLIADRTRGRTITHTTER